MLGEEVRVGGEGEGREGEGDGFDLKFGRAWEGK